MNILTVGNIVSTDFGAYVFPINNHNSSYREYRTVSVAGRSGDILFDNKRYPNVEIGYTWIIMGDFQKQYRLLRQKLLSLVGYQKIWFNDDLEYREGYLSQALEPVMSTDQRSGKFQMYFSCKPQIFLREGNDELEFDDNCSIINPTGFDAKPLIRIYGHGVLTINNTGIIVSPHSEEYIDFDAEIMDAYCGDVNMNKYITLAGKKNPVFRSGKNDINKGYGITKFVITPRWYYV